MCVCTYLKFETLSHAEYRHLWQYCTKEAAQLSVCMLGKEALIRQWLIYKGRHVSQAESSN
jgi:hypothetical protein